MFKKILLLCLLGLSLPLPAKADDARRIVFVTPERTAYHPFWSEFQNAMQAAVEDLGDTFETRYADNDHFHWLEVVKQTASEKPAAIVTLVMKGHAKELLDIVEAAKVPLFIVNAGLTEEQYRDLGQPREKYKYWLGEMTPDDEGAGRMLADYLYKASAKANLAGADGRVSAIGIDANGSDGASVMRKAGLDAALAAEPKLNMLQVVKAKWERPTAKKMAGLLLGRYPDIRMIWSASDAMALGAAEAFAEQGKIAGKDVLLGGVDWSTEGFEAIRKGTMTASVGGHVMEGAWAAVILYDYFHGVDFKDIGLRMKSPMHVVDKGNVDIISQRINAENWKKTDYKKFSRFLNPENKTYNFTLLDETAP
jgi:ABC-type sugar transport system substrate-binding protein